MDKAWLSLLPAVITIASAVWSKKVLPSLLLGLLVGSYLLNPSLIGGFEVAVDSIVRILSDRDNLQVLLFLYLFSGLIALIRKAGGISAFSLFIGKYVKSERGVLFTLWALIPVTFIDCGFRVVGAGSIVRSLAHKYKIKNERFAFMLNNTASPLIELVPIATTFVGFNVANIGQGLKSAGVLEKYSSYNILLHALPYEFFSIVVLIITFISIFVQVKKPEQNSQAQSMQKKSESMMNMDMEDQDPKIQPRLINLIVPMMTVIFLSLYFFWYFGKSKPGIDGSLSSIIIATEPNKAMLLALFISIVITGIIFLLQSYPIKDISKDIISGGNELTNIIAILVLAWALGAVSQDLNLSSFIQLQLGTSLPGWSIPFVLFVLSSAVTYFIGTGWAAASLIMPFAVSLAVAAGSGIPICVAAVITGGTFGDVTSPVAGMTNMASGVAHADHIKYLKYANPYNFAALTIAAILFLVFGFFV